MNRVNGSILEVNWHIFGETWGPIKNKKKNFTRQPAYHTYLDSPIATLMFETDA